jgi:archaellum component FlaC
MTTVTENDLKRLEDLIINGQKAIENRLTAIESGQNRLTEKVESIDKRITVLEARLEAWKPAMDKTLDLVEKVGELKNWRSIAFLILGALAGWIARNSWTNNL